MNQSNQNQQQNQSNNRVQNTNNIQGISQSGQVQQRVQIQSSVQQPIGQTGQVAQQRTQAGQVQQAQQQRNQVQQSQQAQQQRTQVQQSQQAQQQRTQAGQVQQAQQQRTQVQQSQQAQQQRTQVQQSQQAQQQKQNQQSSQQQSSQNIRNVRQISQEELQQQLFGRQLSQEELQKTQVLNLKDVEEVAKMERFTSMKPGVVVAVLGALLLTFGTTFQIANSLQSANNKPKENNIVQKRTVEDDEDNGTDSLVKTVSLNCSKTSLNNSDGTDTVYSIEYQFTNNKLLGFTKTFEMTETEGTLTGTKTVQDYIMAYQAFLNPTTGYQISVTPKAKGLIVTTQVDLSKLDQTTLNPTQQTHFSTSVDYIKDADKDIIETDMVSQGLTCE